MSRFRCAAFSVEFPAAQPPIVGSSRFVPPVPAAPHGQQIGSSAKPGYRELFGDNMPVFPTPSPQGS